jgi:thiol-disulfide isomerase/thioredoxin
MKGKQIGLGMVLWVFLGMLTGCGGEPIDPAMLMDLPEGKTVAEALAGKMVKADGSAAVFEKGKEPDYFVFYFSASWCPPCRAYTPKLVEFYEAHQGKDDGRATFEVILICEDNNQDEMLAYMRDYKMKWLAMEFEERGVRGVPMNPVRAFPAVVIVDNAGKVIDDSGRTSRNAIMEKFARAHL